MNDKPAVRLWTGELHAPSATPPFTLVLRHPGVLRRLVFSRDPLVLAEAYIQGDLDVEGDWYAVLSLKDHIENLSLTWRDKFHLWRDAWSLTPRRSATPDASKRFAHRHSRASDHQAVSFHYDVSNEFYALWLDHERVYSCAYFEDANDSLHDAQCQKLHHICRKLRLRPGERFLDIGCGWGALVCWAAKHYGVKAHGITLSKEQLAFASERIRLEGLGDRVTVELRDYRDLPSDGGYDKIASIGMVEHVGLARMPAYLNAVRQALRPNGLFLNHGITHDDEGWHEATATRFINRYVFPDAELDCIGNMQLCMERAGFEIHDVEGLRPHYALTLRHWVNRLERHKHEAVRCAGEAIYRTWRLYMAACALEFDTGGMGIYQVLASKRHRGAWPLPLTRRDLYA
ncbi:MAG TPA: cyclopropane-fatty-acyl-phospholipid synthase family protein [Burkholderiaceae bacterium]|nr:cyclopropane-fatty-acyl-phospholipid synthase family protein [Burkholderiaceae bacterium]